MIFLRSSCRLWDNLGKCCGARQAIYENKIWCMLIARWISKTTGTHAHAHDYAPDSHQHARTRTQAQARNYALTHTQICNNYSFFTATIVSQTRLSITLCVYFLSFFVPIKLQDIEVKKCVYTINVNRSIDAYDNDNTTNTNNKKYNTNILMIIHRY